MISSFFIHRPIFAAVISILITLIGFLALLTLPIAQYPEITPPGIQVSISYPGASAAVVAQTVAAPIEEQVNGVQGMLYMSSQSGNDGSYTLSVTFDIGTDLNTALVTVQNRVALGMPQLPTEVQMQGITIRKKTPDIIMIVSLFSPDGRYDDIYLSNYATIHIRDELLRLPGVSDINFLGERDYSIRAWLDPQKLAALGMNASDVSRAISAQNVAAAPGQLGQPPIPPGQSVQLPIDTLGRLSTPEQFGDIIVRVGPGAPPQALTVGAAASPLSTGPSSAATPSRSPSGITPASILALLTPTTTSSTGSSGSSGTSTSMNGGTSGANTGGATTGSGGSTSTSGGSITNTNGGASVTMPTTGGQNSGVITGGVMTGGGVSGSMSSGITAGPMTGSVGANSPVSSVPAASALGVISVATGLPSPAPSVVRLRDVARVERGAQNYNNGSTFDGRPACGLAIHQLPGSNALQVGEYIRARMNELATQFPEGLRYGIAYDTTPYIRESVMDVVWTLLEAVGLVAAVVLVFLENWRATLIPLVAVPVAIVGTFAVMAALGFSLNNISLFGLVLAIGIVVDDAIVVVENVERWLDRGLLPHDAARRAMEEVTGPVIAVAVVLCAVFVPVAFLGGIPGQFFRQFAVTISASTLFSALNSLTLSPALAAVLLKPRSAPRDPLAWLLNATLGWFFHLFNRGFSAGTDVYIRLVGWLLRASVAVVVGYGGLIFLTYWVFQRAPTGFVPEQDQGRVIVGIQLPDSSSLMRTQAVIAQVEKIVHATPGVAHTTTAAGISMIMSANSSNFGTMFVVLDPFNKRQSPELSANAIMARIRSECRRQVKDGLVTVFNAPPIPGLSVASGFRLMVEDRTGMGIPELQTQANALSARLHGIPGLTSVIVQLQAFTPQLFMAVNRSKVASLGVALSDVNQTLQIYLGSLYVNSFNAFGRYWQVTLQADGRYRNKVSDVALLQVRNQQGQMVPLATLAQLRPTRGPVMVQRYNLYQAAPIAGNIAPGSSSGDAIQAIDAASLQTLPRTMATEWTEMMFLQIRAGNTAIYVFFLAVVFVFLALAALYESWSLPLAVILVVPLCLLCSVGGVLLTHRSVDIFVQIGLVVLVGLACKNSILIVEFAATQHRQGQPRAEATLAASRLRLRPILMTSFAFILGVVPLVAASGAGAEMRRSLGIAVFTGMLGVTLFGIFLTPALFYVIAWVGETKLFTRQTTLWVGSASAGAAIGLLTAYLLILLGYGHWPRSMILGGVLGAVFGLGMPAFWRVVRRRVFR